MDIRRIRQDGVIALAMAMGILILTTVFAFWRMHQDEKTMQEGKSSAWDKCIENCMEENK